MIRRKQVYQALQTVFGHTEFRPGQKEIIRSVLQQQDTLGLMSTGAGKSLCYQLPSLFLPGITIVISPLIALMQDQVQSLQQKGYDSVTYINSSLRMSEIRQRLLEVEKGTYKIVYIAPERLRSTEFRRLLSALDISLLVVDEAHCISEWGHDFRTDYLGIGDVRNEIGAPPILALTATATEEVVKDIVTQLQMEKPAIIHRGFDRPNLSFVFQEYVSREEKWQAGLAFCRAQTGLGIIYMPSRNETEQFAQFLGSVIGRNQVAYYHAGLSAEERLAVQERFTANQLKVVVATNAFGMGIDKADVRYVLHLHVPSSIEAYYQEAGRAGRDGRPSICAVFYQPQDRGIHQFFLKREYPDDTKYQAAVAMLSQIPSTQPVRIEWEWLLQLPNVTEDNWELLFHIWEQLHALRRLDGDGLSVTVQIEHDPLIQLKPQVMMYLSRLRSRRQGKLFAMYQLLQTQECRRSQILRYFQSSSIFTGNLDATSVNEILSVPCCDVCDGSILESYVTKRQMEEIAVMQAAAAVETMQSGNSEGSGMNSIAQPTYVPGSSEPSRKSGSTMLTEEEEAYQIGELRDRNRLPRLYELLRSQRVNTRRLACSAIGKIADPNSTSYVASCLLDPNPQVRQYAIKALMKIGDPASAPVVRELLAREDKEYNIRAAREFLGAMKQRLDS